VLVVSLVAEFSASYIVCKVCIAVQIESSSISSRKVKVPA